MSKELYEEANEKFKNIDKINCYQGNSKDILIDILSKVQGKCLFWLDAHYSGLNTAKGDNNTPILNELKIIFDKLNEGVILIDDARAFGTEKDYPSKFKLKKFILQYKPNAEIELYDDIIRVIL